MVKGSDVDFKRKMIGGRGGEQEGRGRKRNKGAKMC